MAVFLKVTFFCVFLFISTSLNAQTSSQEEQLWHHRNLGKAFYENPVTQYDAVGEFKKALDLAPGSARDRINYGLSLLRAGKTAEGVAELEAAQQQDPGIPHTWFNLGIAYKRESRYEDAIQQFERMIELVPDEPISRYNLGVLYKQTGQQEESVQQFQKSAVLDPNLAGPHYQLATAFRSAGRQEDFKREMAVFLRIKREQANAAVPADLEWSLYSEIYETIDPAFATDNGSASEMIFSSVTLENRQDTIGAGFAIFDADADDHVDVLFWSNHGMKLFKQGKDLVTSGLEGVKDVIAAIPGDVDNDGFVDICLVTRDGAALYINSNGRFQLQKDGFYTGQFNDAIWLDYDHDYDIDLFLLGSRSVLMRNEGTAVFSDQSANFPFVEGQALNGAPIDLIADTQGMDLVVIYANRAGVIYRDRLAAKYEAQPLEELATMTEVVTADFDNDGWTDLAAGNTSGISLFVNDQKGGFTILPAPKEAKIPFVFADLENRSISELIAGGRLYRNLGLGKFAAGSELISLPTAIGVADIDNDGRLDVSAVGSGGKLEVWYNKSDTDNHWLRISVTGVKNLKLAPGAEIEVKAGTCYQKKIYHGIPLLFGLASYEQADVVRITWPNGLIQNETRQATERSVLYTEAQRLSGSCPMIFAWNGETFQFITDVLGVAPLGASSGDNQYFPVDHDEYIQLPLNSMKPNNDGHLEIRITEELREVAYIDEISLIAIDHPQKFDIFVNDKFKGPPFPDFRLFGVAQRIYPIRAQDHQQRDVLQEILTHDRTYPDHFERDYAGVAEKHFIELDFGKQEAEGRAILVLNGWVDWADGSTYIGNAQRNPDGLIMPYLQVKDSQGKWKTVIEDMGMPAGKPKTIVVDLTDRFLSSTREVRIVTNLCVYWDEIFLSTDFEVWRRESLPQTVRLTDLHAMSADLNYKGFSQPVIHPERKQPEMFIYDRELTFPMWNPTPGKYTRYGDVRELSESIDDRLIIMGSGDELRLTFDPGELPTLAPGWRRDYLLFVDGWAKDGDANTAFSQTVEPLPYHGMPQYPYAEPYVYPQDVEHNSYRTRFNTRPARRLIRPLSEALQGNSAASADVK
ncbi:MAG: tetratricopeptide repeat protein [Candidatus Latescibacteria bacterium]|nr:tetratricopeptide repeat protein [Candidatus Latescibacterota bacterium]